MNLFEHDWYITKFPICINVILPVRNTVGIQIRAILLLRGYLVMFWRHFWHLDIKGAGNHPTMSKTAPPTPQHNTELSSTNIRVAKQVRDTALVNKMVGWAGRNETTHLHILQAWPGTLDFPAPLSQLLDCWYKLYPPVHFYSLECAPTANLTPDFWPPAPPLPVTTASTLLTPNSTSTLQVVFLR